MSDNTYDQQPDIRMPRTQAGIPPGGYKLYSAILVQTSTNAPIATVLNNTLGDIVWTRVSQGIYRGTLTGKLTTGRVQVFGQAVPGSTATQVLIDQTSELPNDILIETYEAGSFADGLLNHYPIHILVYDQTLPTFPFTPTPPVGTQIYTAIIDQTGTAAPTVQVLHNTLGTIIWSYDSTGYYIGTLAGAFKENKRWAIITNGGGYVDNAGDYIDAFIFFANGDEDHVFVASEFDGALSNGQLTQCPLEIRIYN